MNSTRFFAPAFAATVIAMMLGGCASMREPSSEAVALPDAGSAAIASETLPDWPVPAATPSPADTLAHESPQQAVIARALQLLGVKYRYGGSEPRTGFDCSGFVRYVFREMPVPELPRASSAMIRAIATEVPRDSLQPGDLLFFKIRRGVVSHVGIYLGDGQFIHAPRGGGKVRVERVDERYWRATFAGARRVLPSLDGGSATIAGPAAR